MTTTRYAKGPVVYLYDRKTLKKKTKELLWGDWLRIGEDIDDQWAEVHWGKTIYGIKKQDFQQERLLELIFLDVGQGDGCILTAPYTGDKEKVMIVDAGVGSNMNSYLEYRFRDFKKKYTFDTAVITHPDSDHYKGFQKIFDNPHISFNQVYHNGLLERTGKNLLGPVSDGYLTDICTDKTEAKKLYSDAKVRGGKYYPKLLWTALNSNRFKDVSMLSTEHGVKEQGKTWMAGFAPSDNEELTIEVLGPVVETAPNGKHGLRTFAATPTGKAMSKGKTKNGHSIILRLNYRGFSVLFGGDLNTPAEYFLMRHYGNNGKTPTTLLETNAMIDKAKARFGVDMMKCCHHGSADVTDEFLQATHPLAYVVSSGDEESHVHPRPDLLGLLGRKGRGDRPLVLCTEILRSTREKEDPALRGKLNRLNKKIDSASDEAKLTGLKQARSKIHDELFKRNVGVYGAVNLRTDGHTAVVAFRKEKPKGVSRWFCYVFEKDANGVFVVKGSNRH